MVYKVSRFICWLFSLVFFPIKVYGVDNLPREGAFILASNHISNLDPIILGVMIRKRRPSFIAKDSLFSNFFTNWYMHSLGALPAKRNQRDIGVLREALKRLNKGEILILFPEGTRNTKGEIHDAQSGVGFLAAKSEVPVFPAFIEGSHKVLPKGALLPKRSHISVYLGKQIPIERSMPYQDIANCIMESVRHLSCRN